MWTETLLLVWQSSSHQWNRSAQFYRLRWEFYSINHCRRYKNKQSLHLTNVSVVSYTLDLPYIMKKNCNITDFCHRFFFFLQKTTWGNGFIFYCSSQRNAFLWKYFLHKSCLISPVIFPFLLNQSPRCKAVFHLVTFLYGLKFLMFVCWVE